MLSMNATSIAPPIPMIALGRPLANVVFSPVWGSTREIVPTAPSVTYSAIIGADGAARGTLQACDQPVAVGPSHGGAALAADGVIIAIRAAANISKYRYRLISSRASPV
jgi:hypothetical protein